MDVPRERTESMGNPWLWVVRGVALMAVGVAVYGALETYPNDLGVFLVLGTPYLVLLVLSSLRPTQRLAAAVAVLLGLVGTLGAALLLWMMLLDGGFESRQVLISWLILLCHVPLVMAGIVHYRRGRHHWRLEVGAATVVVLILLVVALPTPVRRPRGYGNESAAVGSLRTIVTAQVTYAMMYPERGFASTLKALGPAPGGEASAEAADLIDGTLASGEKGGYQFKLTLGAPDEEGRITSFRAIARPMVPGRTGIRSFHVDESGVIRQTAEDREATAEDPPV